MRKLWVSLTLFFCILCLTSQQIHADEEPSLQSQVNELKERLKELKSIVEKQQQEIAQLKQSQETPPVQSVAQSQTQAGPTRAKFIPEIGVVADVALKLDSPRSDTGGADRVSVREVELVLGSNVDPFSRLDSTIAFSEESTAELEEAYLTRFGLPLNTTARIGRVKPKIGKALPVHRDSLDTADEPLVIQRYFGTEGMNKSGVDVTTLLDIPSPMVHQVTLGLLEGGTGDGGTIFGSTKRRPTLYTHLKNYLDITDLTNLEIGTSYAVGSKDLDAGFEVNVIGLDATWLHHLNSIQNVKLQGEAFHTDRRESVDAATREDLNGHLWGGYGLFDFRISSQYATGFRWDYVELVDNPVTNPHKADLGYSGYLTFYQSEFARWRAQVSHFDLASGKNDNQVLIQGTFAMGEHKHKLQ